MSPTEPQTEHMNYLPHWQARRGLILPIIFFFVCLFIFCKINGPLVISSNQNNTFTIDGTGEAKGTPTKAEFSLTVTAKDATQKGATDMLNTRMKKIVDDLKSTGIRESDIKTTNLQTYPEYSTSPVPLNESGVSVQSAGGSAIALPPVSQSNGKISQWTASESITVKADRNDLAQKALSVTQLDGADPAVNGIQYTFDTNAQKQLEQQARVTAIKDAKTKAEELAKESGLKLGRITNITENGSPVFQTAGAMKSDAAQSAPEPQLNPGQNTVTKTVTLYYETR